MNKLLKEAVADAKAIREIALANAKQSLEETFRPRLEKMIGEKIRQEVEGDGTEGGEGEVPAEVPAEPTEPDGDEMPEVPEVEVEPGTEDSTESEPEGEDFGDETLELSEGGAGTKVTTDAGNDPEKAKGSKTTVATLHEEEEDEDLSVESIIRELEQENDESDLAEEVQFGGKVTSDAGKDSEKASGKNKPYRGPGTKEDMGAIKESEDSDEDDEKIDEKIEKFSTIKKPATHPVKEQYAEGEEDIDETIETYPSLKSALPSGKLKSESAEEEIDLDEILKELESDELGDEPVEQPEVEDSYTDDTLAAENEQLKQDLGTLHTELEEHRKVVTFLKARLNEINLLNAKLLFTNKIFKNHALDNNQKIKVIESFDLARTLREAKLVYTTISESFSKPAAKKSVKKLTEGIASRVIKSTQPAREKAIKESSIIDGGSAERMKKLAGIIK